MVARRDGRYIYSNLTLCFLESSQICSIGEYEGNLFLLGLQFVSVGFFVFFVVGFFLPAGRVGGGDGGKGKGGRLLLMLFCQGNVQPENNTSVTDLYCFRSLLCCIIALENHV